MKRGLLLGLAVVAVGGLAAVAVVAAGGDKTTTHGVKWDKSTCMPTHVDAEIKPWLEANLLRLVKEQDIKDGEQLVTAVFRELVPQECKGRFPPLEGTQEARDWALVLAMYSDFYQVILNNLRLQMEGKSLALNYDPNQALVAALIQSID